MSYFVNREYDELREIGYLSYYTRGLEGSFIAGGCFKNIFLKQPVKDIDIFFETEIYFNRALEKVLNWKGTVKTYENEKCVGFQDTETGMKFELIRSVFGRMDEVIENFDFTITKFAFQKYLDGSDEFGDPEYSYDIIHHEDFFQHLAQKRLVIDSKVEDIPFPFSTYERMFRYAKYGFQPCRETKIKMIEAIRMQEEFTADQVSKSMYDGGWD